MYKFIHAEKAEFPIVFSCRVLGVARSAYYRWLSGCRSTRSIEDRRLEVKIRAIHTNHKGRYGSPRIHRELREYGHRVSRKRVARLMSVQGLTGRSPRRFRKTTDARHSQRIAPNVLNRNFIVDARNKVWVGDVTYIPTRQGWLYLAVLLDLYSRRVVGWAMSDTIDTRLVLDALRMAASDSCLPDRTSKCPEGQDGREGPLAALPTSCRSAVRSRKPRPGLLHHTDRDGRYASDEYRTHLRSHGLVPSMSRKANCWDNAVAESFFATLEKELLDDEVFFTRTHARQCVADYIENYYNNRRRHSHLDYVSPLEYEIYAAA